MGQTSGNIATAASPFPAQRRQRLLAHPALQNRAALFPAGDAVGRNYRGNPYPFRASSHFLYLVGDAGQDLAGSWLLLHAGQAKLFTHAPSQEDALWHGPSASLAEWAEHLGLEVASLTDLDDEVSKLRNGGQAVAGLPAPDAASAGRQAVLLGRMTEEGSMHHDDDLALTHAMVELRCVHDEGAVAGLKEAAEATCAAHRAGMRATRAGLREWQVKAAMEAPLLERGMTTAYGPIVTRAGEVLHNHAYHHELQSGDLLLADVGAETRGGWAGDVTRTWPVSGKFSSTQREMYDVVLASQLAAIEKCRTGVRYRDVHLAACEKLAEGLVALGILQGDPAELVADDVHALFFPHGVGHLIGLDVHDMEDLGDHAGYASDRQRSERFGLGYLRLDRDLRPGMAVTIEPGFYRVPAILADDKLTASAKGRLDFDRLAKFEDVRGIRIEDDILVTEDEPEVLTAAIEKTTGDVEGLVGAA